MTSCVFHWRDIKDTTQRLTKILVKHVSSSKQILSTTFWVSLQQYPRVERTYELQSFYSLRSHIVRLIPCPGRIKKNNLGIYYKTIFIWKRKIPFFQKYQFKEEYSYSHKINIICKSDQIKRPFLASIIGVFFSDGSDRKINMVDIYCLSLDYRLSNLLLKNYSINITQ